MPHKQRKWVQAFLLQKIGALQSYQVVPELGLAVAGFHLVKPIEFLLLQANLEQLGARQIAEHPYQVLRALADQLLDFRAPASVYRHFLEHVGSVDRMKQTCRTDMLRRSAGQQDPMHACKMVPERVTTMGRSGRTLLNQISLELIRDHSRLRALWS